MTTIETMDEARAEIASLTRTIVALEESRDEARRALEAIAARVLVDGQRWTYAGLPEDVRRAMDKAESDAEALDALRAAVVKHRQEAGEVHYQDDEDLYIAAGLGPSPLPA